MLSAFYSKSPQTTSSWYSYTATEIKSTRKRKDTAVKATSDGGVEMTATINFTFVFEPAIIGDGIAVAEGWTGSILIVTTLERKLRSFFMTLHRGL